MSFDRSLKSAWIRRSTLAACAVMFLTGSLSALGEEGLQISSDRSVVSVKAGQEPVLVYQYSERPRKAYLKQLFSPGGVNVLRDAPADHLHHHGLMFAVAADGVDFWSENDNCGRQRHVGLSDMDSGVHSGVPRSTFTQQVDWIGPDGKTLLLRERRTIDVGRMPNAGPTLLRWQTRLEVPSGKPSATLSGSPYFGLGMRFVQSMDVGGTFRNADGKTGVKGTNDVRSAWCAYAAAADARPVTVAMFDCPQNPRCPATWFTMDSAFAYLSATLSLHKEPLVVEAGKPLELQYAVALWDGHVGPERIEALYRQLLKRAAEAEAP